MEQPYVLLETTLGELLIELYPDKAPATVANFLRYIDEGHYNGTIFHRVVRNFVSQAGGYDRELALKPTHAPVVNEADNGLSNEKNTIAMARSPEKDSATAQFFINAADNTELDHQDDSDEGFGYCVFGSIADGEDVAKKINWRVVTPQGEFEALPVEQVWIVSARRFE